MSSNPPDPQKPASAPRDAVIFIPGISQGWIDQSVDGVAQRIATAMDRGAQTAGAKFRLEGHDEDYREGFKTRVCTIIRSDPGKDDTACADVYGMEYNNALTRRFEAKTPLVKSWLVCWTIFRNVPKLLRLFTDRAKSFREKLQLVYAQSILALLGIYLGLLIVALVGIVQQLQPAASTEGPPPAAAQQTSNTTPSPPAPAQTQSQVPSTAPATIWNRAGTWSAMIVVLLNALLFLVPPKVAWKDFVSRTATEYLCLIYYFSVGERRNVLLGQLEALLEHIAEKDEVVYRRIHIIGYSFGTIIALDGLFNSARKPSTRFSRVHTLVTIGCPFDMVRMFWPRYFERRECLPGHPERWLNVYSPLDILSSNFRNDTKIAAADRTIGLTKPAEEGAAAPIPYNLPFLAGVSSNALGFIDMLLLDGIRFHSMYWEAAFEAEISCFHDVVAAMYQGDAVLA